MNSKSFLALKVAKALCIVTVLTLSVLLIPNLPAFDEKLSPDIEHLLEKSVDPTSITNNGAVYSYGIKAASAKDPQKVGEAVIARLREKHRRNEPVNLSEPENTEIFGAEDSDKKWQDFYPSVVKCNPKNENNCFESLFTEISLTPVTEERLLTQFARYRKLTQQQHFVEDVEIMDASSPLPPYNLILQVGRLRNANTYHEGGFTQFLQTLTENSQFWRMALNDTQTLVGKMVAVGALRADLHSLSFGLRNEKELTENQRVIIKNLLTPLDSAETAMDKALLSELRLVTKERRQFLKYFAKVPSSNTWLLSKMIQPTASVNLFYRQTFEPAYQLTSLTAQDFYLKTQQLLKPHHFSPVNPYNLGGKIHLSETWQLAGYIGRVHDLIGLYSMVSLQLDLLATEKENYETVIKKSGYRNPYTQKPFDFDEEIKEISFVCFDARDSCRIKL